MSVREAEIEYERLKAKTSIPEELWAGYWKLVKEMDKLNIAYYNTCDNDEQWGDIWP